MSWGGLAGWVGLCGVNATSCGGGRSQCFPRLGWEDEEVTAKVGAGRNAFLDWAGEDEEVTVKVGAGRTAFLDWAEGDEEDTAKCWAHTQSRRQGAGGSGSGLGNKWGRTVEEEEEGSQKVNGRADKGHGGGLRKDTLGARQGGGQTGMRAGS